MVESGQSIEGRPIRVVVFSSGPALEHDVRQFLARLEAHPDIELLAVFCQSAGGTLADVVRDLWQRRRWLAAPLLAMKAASAAAHNLRHPLRERQLRRQMRRIASRIHDVPDIHSQKVLEQVCRLAPDLGLIYGSPILKPSLFEIPARGTLGIHHGQAPQYRGKKTTFWAMYNGEAVAGVTIQKVTAGLDTGPIVISGAVPIGRRTYGVVARDLLDLGIELYLKSILQVKAGTAAYRPQEGPKGKLYRDPKAADLIRFWRRQWRRRFLAR
jgi:folate-dependent phosphoribosylglycinamide formyltransferase PurN